MKKLSEIEVSTITNSMLRNNRTQEEIEKALLDKEAKLNEQKKESFWDNFDECDESGMI